MKHIIEFLINSKEQGLPKKYRRPTTSQWLTRGVLAFLAMAAVGCVLPKESESPLAVAPSSSPNSIKTSSPTSSLSASPSLSSPSRSQVAAKPANPTVASITDGDTLKLSDGRILRLACIDAPEMSQTPYGEQAKSYLAGLLPVDSVVQVKALDTDKYGRTVAEVTVNGTLVNIAMLKAAQAKVYDEYVSTCPNPEQYYAAETKTQFEAPSTHRYQTGQATTAEPNISSSSVSSEGDKDCSDFSTQAEAQEYLLPGDPHRLDRDDDGVACESN